MYFGQSSHHFDLRLDIPVRTLRGERIVLCYLRRRRGQTSSRFMDIIYQCYPFLYRKRVVGPMAASVTYASMALGVSGPLLLPRIIVSSRMLL